MKKRVFIGIDLPKEVKEEFSKFFKKTERVSIVKWEQPEKLHLTLVFLGFAEEKKLPALTLLLHRIRVESKLVLVIASPLSGFPTIANPRVLWLSLEGDIKRLGEITAQLQKMLKDKDFLFDEREFTPHLTIGRFKKGIKKQEKEKVLKTIVDSLPKFPLKFTIRGITLFASRLTPRGSFYQVLAYENFGN